MHYQAGEVRLSRIEYMSLPVPPELVGLSSQDVEHFNGAEPWLIDDQVVISAAAWAAEIGDKRVIFDPMQAVDVLLRADEAAEQQHQHAIAEKFTELGFSPESIDMVLMTHIEGVGMVAHHDQGEWRPFFPNAKIYISNSQLEAFHSFEPDPSDPVQNCWQALLEQDAVATYQDGEEVLPGVVAEVTGYHCDGHSVFHFNQAELTFIGHLAVSPVHISSGPCEALNEHPKESFQVLQRIIADGRQLIGPLWPEPGVGRWTSEGLK